MSVHTHYRLFALGLLVAVMAGCAATGSRSASATEPVERVNTNVISAEEIRTAAAANAHELVSSLRPRWLFKRGPQSVAAESDIIIYMEGARMGGVQALREIPASTLQLLEFFDATKANFKFGRGHPYGAIVVHLAGRPSQ